MGKNISKPLMLVVGLIAVLLSFSVIVPALQRKESPQQNVQSSQVQQPNGAYFNYSGEEGKTALDLLKEQGKVEQDNSGLIVSINGRKTDNTKREYWAFYVNGKMAHVGPAEYTTKTGDHIEWKIEKY